VSRWEERARATQGTLAAYERKRAAGVWSEQQEAAWQRKVREFAATIALQQFLGSLIEAGATAADVRRALTTVGIQNDEDVRAA
jgi:hypothetical protein